MAEKPTAPQNQPDREEELPYCYGVLDNVFPLGADGLRSSPESCLPCIHKTRCLREALERNEGLKVRHEVVDRAYSAGMIGFLDRWSRKKKLHRISGHGRGWLRRLFKTKH